MFAPEIMAKSRQLKGRIRSVQNTRKITKTMELVATSKLKRAQDRVVAARPYAEALREVIADLFTPDLADRFPLLRRPAPPSKGGPQRAARDSAHLEPRAGRRLQFQSDQGSAPADRVAGSSRGTRSTCTGSARRGSASSSIWAEARPGAHGHRRPADRGARGRDRGQPLIEAYAAGELASVELVQARFISALQTPPTTVRILPVEQVVGQRGSGAAGQRGSGGRWQRITFWRRVPRRFCEELLPLYVRNMVYRGLVETAAAEHGARRTAMKNATDNAGEILELLKRTYNRQRQAQITQEIAEIVGGAAALQG